MSGGAADPCITNGRYGRVPAAPHPTLSPRAYRVGGEEPSGLLDHARLGTGPGPTRDLPAIGGLLQGEGHLGQLMHVLAVLLEAVGGRPDHIHGLAALAAA